MDKYNWTGVFPDTPKHFHAKVEEALLRLPEEKEKSDMGKTNKKISVKKTVLIAFAAVMVLGATALAAGKVVSISSHSSAVADYTKLPDQAEVKAVIGMEAKLVDTFSNGYRFQSGHIGKSQAEGENGEVLKAYKDLRFEYKKGKEEVSLHMSPLVTGPGEVEELAGNFQGVDLYYYAYANKCVAGDYELTEQDKADIESGKYVFSYGVEEENPIQVQSLSWIEGGITYDLLVMDSELNREDLVEMAEEIIQAQ